MKDVRSKPRWRLLHVPSRSGAENMARDVALMDRAQATGEIVFSIYSWTRPTLSLGRNQRTAGCYDQTAMKSMGVDVVRRPTGGRALLHHHEVTYSVTAPLASVGTLRNTYERINDILLSGLSKLGVSASASGDESAALPPNGIPCFAVPAKGELIVDGRKLVGSAQWRNENAILQHGSILIENDQQMIDLFSTRAAVREVIPPPATLKTALGFAPDLNVIADAMFHSVRDLEDMDAQSLDEAEIRPSAIERTGEFENELWTWRR